MEACGGRGVFRTALARWLGSVTCFPARTPKCDSRPHSLDMLCSSWLLGLCAEGTAPEAFSSCDLSISKANEYVSIILIFLIIKRKIYSNFFIMAALPSTQTLIMLVWFEKQNTAFQPCSYLLSSSNSGSWEYPLNGQSEPYCSGTARTVKTMFSSRRFIDSVLTSFPNCPTQWVSLFILLDLSNL